MGRLLFFRISYWNSDKWKSNKGEITMTLTLEKAIVRERHFNNGSSWDVIYPDRTRSCFVGEDAEYQAKECADRWNEQYVTSNMVIGGYDE